MSHDHILYLLVAIATYICGTVMDTQEYLTLKRNALQLEDAVQSDLVTISGKLHSKGLISEKIEARLKDESKSSKDRAAKLVTVVTNVVKLKPEQYNVFVEILQEGGIDVIRPMIVTQDKPRSMVCKIQCMDIYIHKRGWGSQHADR